MTSITTTSTSSSTSSPGHPAVEQLSAYLAGDLCDRDAATVRRHLGGCAACEGVADELGRQTVALGTLDRPEPPVTMWAAIEGACDAEVPRGWGAWASALGSWRVLASGAVGLGVGAVLVSGAFVWGPWSSHRGLGLREHEPAPASWPGGVVLEAAPSGPTESARWTEAPAVVGAAGVAAFGAPAIARGTAAAPVDPLLAEAESELRRAALAYQAAAGRLRTILDRDQLGWDPAQRVRVAERLARLDEAVAHTQALARSEPGDGGRAEMLFAAYQKQIDFLAEVVQRGGSSLPMPLGEALR